MNRLLAIETSGEACSVALSDHGRVTESYVHAPMQHAELLLPAVREVLEGSGLAMSDLDAIAFGRGPGSFTSLRIGIGVVQGLAWGADLPVIPVSSLAAVAQEAWERAGRSELPVCVAMDARMNEVFSAQFAATERGVVEATQAETVGPASALLDEALPFIAAGNGFERFPELSALRAEAAHCFHDLWPRASTVLNLAQHWLQDNEALPAAGAQPVYIRNDVASKPGAV